MMWLDAAYEAWFADRVFYYIDTKKPAFEIAE
jgi:hypothetical protein